MSSVEGQKNPRFITALIAEQVDWSLFYERHAKEHLESWFPSQDDFHEEAADSVSFTYGRENSRFPIITKSAGLKTFLERNRPPTIFFSPEDVNSLLTPESNIICNKEETRTSQRWEFTLNPQKHEVSPSEQQTITLTRKKAGTYDRLEPYLVVGFAAGHNGFHVTFDPEIKRTWEDTPRRNKLEEEMIKLLGLKQHKVEQSLNFRAKEENVQILYEPPIGRPPDSLEQAIKDKKLKGYFVLISLQFESSSNVSGLSLRLAPEGEGSHETHEVEASDMGSVEYPPTPSGWVTLTPTD